MEIYCYFVTNITIEWNSIKHHIKLQKGQVLEADTHNSISDTFEIENKLWSYSS